MATLAQKLIARAARREHVSVGEIVTCQVDLAMSHDSSGPRRVAPMLDELGARPWDPSKYVIVTDHYVSSKDPESEQILRFTRDWVKQESIENFYDDQGICHVVLPENGHILPGSFIVGGDSHSTTGGAFGAYMFGIGATEMLGVLVTGEIWLRVPHTILIEWTGHFSTGVSAKDVMLFLSGHIGSNGGRYQAIEFTGEAIDRLPMQERMTLCNMATELGAQVGLIAPDACTWEYLKSVGVKDIEALTAEAANLKSDADSSYLAHYKFDASKLEPYVAAPHSHTNSMPVSQADQAALTICYLGACTGAKEADLRMAAAVLKDRKIHAQIRLLVAPASLQVQTACEHDGTMDILRSAGAEILPTGCGACAGYGSSRFGENERIIASTARNFRGRMAAESSQVWLGSPLTVAASALAGRIADPRLYMDNAS